MPSENRTRAHRGSGFVLIASLIALAVVAGVLLFRVKINSAWLVLAGGVIGLAVSYLG